MTNKLLKTLNYFSFFHYSPSFDEIHLFFPKKISKKDLQEELKILVDKKVILECPNATCYMLHVDRYTLGEYSIKVKNPSFAKASAGKQNSKFKISQEKIKKIQNYIKILSYFPHIQLVGLSGTVAMMNAKEDDDIDLFIITGPNRLWTGRFIAIFVAKLLRLHRKQGESNIRDKVCLNLFFDKTGLEIADFKKTEYVAREILQMKPLINKNLAHETFLKANRWVGNYFPNAEIKSKIQNPKSNKISIFKSISKFKNFKLNENFKLKISNYLGNCFENILKRLQLISIKQHQTNEIITDTQLWFFPKDFEQEIVKTKD